MDMGGSRRGWVLSMKFRASSLDCQNTLCNTKTHWDGQRQRSQEARTRRPSDGGCLWDETPQQCIEGSTGTSKGCGAGSCPQCPEDTTLSPLCTCERACYAKHTYKSQAINQ